MEAWAGAVLDALESGNGPAKATAAMGAARAAIALPYKGLAAFQLEDAPLFFGRSDLVDKLVARLQQRATLVVGGPSGSGKSSLMRAGLLAALRAGALPGSERWPVCLLTPGERPLSSLSKQLGGLSGVATFPDEEALRAQPQLIRQAISTTVLVAIDQFEELFKLCGDEVEREAFLRVLEALTSGADPIARVVLAVRADFYSACAERPWLAEAINENNVLVGPMSRPQLRQAIEGPARRVGLHLEDGLAERVLTDAADDPGALPLVAHAMVETWLRREGTLLTISGYEAAGGVAGATGRTADQVWSRLGPEEQRCARRLLLRLVHPGQGTPDTKRLLPWAEVGDDGPTRLVLSRFSDSRLLTLDHQGVQLAHEALLHTWGRLAAWVEESRDRLREAERIADAATEWERQGRHADLLYRGLPLAAALEWRAHQDSGAGEPIASFLGAGVAARDAELSAAQEQGRRARRRRQRVLLSLATLTTLALITSLVAIGALGASRRDERAARAASSLASEQLARGLAASAVDLGSSIPYLATMLAAEAVARVNPPLREARDALVRSRIALGGSRLVPYGDPMPVGDALAVAVAPAGGLAATGSADGTVALWDLERHVKVAEVSGPSGGIHTMAFTADARWLVGASSDHRIWRWPLQGGAAGAGSVLADAGSIVWAVAAAPTGTTVAAVTDGGDVQLVDAATGAQEGGPIRSGAGELFSVSFSPDGTSLLAGSVGGDVYAWSLPSRQLRFPPVHAHSSDVWEVIPGPGSTSTFASVSYADGTARLWKLVDGAPVVGGPFADAEAGVPGGVRGVTFDPDGETLTLGGTDGALYSWSISGRRLVERLGPVHRSRVIRAARSQDGLILATLGDDHTLQVWTQRPRLGPVVRLTQLSAHASSIAVAPGGTTLAVGADDGAVYLLDPLTGRQLSRLTGQSGSVTGLAFTGAGRLITGDSAGTMRQWDLSTARVRIEHRGAHQGAINALAIDEARQVLATGGTDGRVRLWAPASLTALGPGRPELSAPVTGIALGANGQVVAASTEHGDVGVWTIAGRPVVKPFRVTNDAVWAVALGGGGRILAAAGADEVLSLWSLADGRGPLRVHELGSNGGALDVTFVDPGVVAVSSAQGTVQLWDAASGQAIGPILPVSASPVWHLAAAPNGSVWTASRDGTITHIDALTLDVACAQASGSFDASQRARLLAGRAPIACPQSHTTQ